MIYVKNTNTDPALNHGLEEYFMKETDEDVFMIWRNEPSVLLGKNQYTFAEINVPEARKRGIQIVRRKSGGGTVYGDLENCQYTFISRQEKGQGLKESFEIFAEPVVEGLRSLGLDASFTGRNDILIEGKKISGNAQYRFKDRVVHHGTLLFDSDFDSMNAVLNSRKIKLKSKGVKSIASRVCMIKDYLPEMKIEDFISYLADYIVDYYQIDKVLDLDPDLIAKTEVHAKEFRDEARNMGKDYSSYKEYSVKYDFGLLEYKMMVDKGKIGDLQILGDYFEQGDVDELEGKLIGSEIEEQALKKVLQENPGDSYIENISNEILIGDLLKTANS